MKTYTFSISMFLCMAWSMFLHAQSNPGTDKLMHQWSFNDGTANDNVLDQPVNGILHGGATVSDNALQLSEPGQFLSFSGTDIAINSYESISQEIWFTPKKGANGSFAHITYFGQTVGGNGYNYISMMPARGDNVSRVEITEASFSGADFCDGPEIDDGQMHQFVSVVNADSLFFYIDGRLISKKNNTVPLASLNTSLAYVGKSGFENDPTWIGSVSKYSLYNKTLQPDEVLFLYESGAEDEPQIITSSSDVSFPEPGSKKIAVWALNLHGTISLTAPEGFTVTPSELPAGAQGDSVVVMFNGGSSASGAISLKSGDTEKYIFVEGSLEPGISTSLQSILLDELNRAKQFSVSGYNLSADIKLTAPAGVKLSPAIISASAGSVTVSVVYDGMSSSSGTIDLISETATARIELVAIRTDDCFDKLYPRNLIFDPGFNKVAEGEGNVSINTNPEFVYCGTTSGKIADGGKLVRNLTGLLKPNTDYRMRAKVYKYHPKIKAGDMGLVSYTLDLDSAAYPLYYRLISEAMDSACRYYSKYTPFIKDVYVYYSDGIPTAQASNLGAIGYGSNISYMWVGTAIHELAHYFGSGTTNVWKSLMSSRVWAGVSGAAIVNELAGAELHGDAVHFWPYGINYRSEITDLGSQEAQQQGLIDATKVVKAMLVDDCKLPTYNTVAGIGIHGWNKGAEDIFYEAPIANEWYEIDFSFTTGNELAEMPKLYFSGEAGYIDNLELYEVRAKSKLEISLTQGWNLISLPIELFDMRIPSVFPHAQIVKDTDSFFDASLPPALNTLSYIEAGAGYLLYNSVDESLQLDGVLYSDDIPAIHPGNGAWQLVGFPWHEAVGISDVLNNQSTSPQIIKNFDQLWTSEGGGTLEYIVPGKGYFVK